MINIDYRSGVAIYEQITKGIERLIHCGGLVKDQKLPSVREFSAELAVNPNTVQKAYSILEQKGLIYSVKGLGNFVSGDTDELLTLHYEKLLVIIKDNIKEILLLGYDPKQLAQKLSEFSKKGGGIND